MTTHRVGVQTFWRKLSSQQVAIIARVALKDLSKERNWTADSRLRQYERNYETHFQSFLAASCSFPDYKRLATRVRSKPNFPKHRKRLHSQHTAAVRRTEIGEMNRKWLNAKIAPRSVFFHFISTRELVYLHIEQVSDSRSSIGFRIFLHMPNVSKMSPRKMTTTTFWRLPIFTFAKFPKSTTTLNRTATKNVFFQGPIGEVGSGN